MLEYILNRISSGKLVEYFSKEELASFSTDAFSGLSFRKVLASYSDFQQNKRNNVDDLFFRKKDSYCFSIEKFLVEIHNANEMSGVTHQITDTDFYYIGNKVYNGIQMGYVFASDISRNLYILLAGLRSTPSCYQDDYIVVFTPSLKSADRLLSWKLFAINIIHDEIHEYLDEKTFVIDFDKLLNPLLLSKIKPYFLKETKQEISFSDEDKYEYKCNDYIYIPYKEKMTNSYTIKVNDHDVKMDISLFYFFFRFIVELKKGKGGWVSVGALCEEGFISDPMGYQKYSRLRKALGWALLEKNPKELLENNGVKEYRISVAPSNVRCDLEAFKRSRNGVFERIIQC